MTESPGRPPRLSHSSWTLGRIGEGPFCFTSTEVRWLIRDGDGGGGGGGGNERVKARPRIPPEKAWTERGEDRRQNNGSVLVHCAAQLPFQLPCLGSHNDNVRCTAVEKHLEAKRSPTCATQRHLRLLLISSGLTWRSSSIPYSRSCSIFLALWVRRCRVVLGVRLLITAFASAAVHLWPQLTSSYTDNLFFFFGSL